MSIDDTLLARIALHYKLVRQDQLTSAAERQRTTGESLLAALVGLGCLTSEQEVWLQKALAQYASRQAQQKADAEKAARPGPSAQAPAQSQVRVAPAAPQPLPPSPMVSAPAQQHQEKSLAPAKVEQRFVGPPKPATPAPPQSPIQRSPSPRSGAAIGANANLSEILAYALEVGASDVHVHSGAPIQLRIVGGLQELRPGQVTESIVQGFFEEVLSVEERVALHSNREFDTAIALPSVGRFRAAFYKQQRGWDAVFRPIPSVPPTLAQLGLPASLKRLTEFHQGLVLLTGPTGSGKSSTLAALVALLNDARPDHIITVEDPIEFVHIPKKCVVNQRQVGKHTRSFPNALRAALREDPDIVVIGELRDLETISLAITAAETGHLVLGTLHTNNAIRTINRILDAFPPKQQAQMRAMVSESLRAVSSQKLLVSADGSKRVVATELLLVKPAVSNLIREEKTFQIRSVIQTGRSEGMVSMDDSLAELVKAGAITKAVAARAAEDPRKFG